MTLSIYLSRDNNSTTVLLLAAVPPPNDRACGSNYPVIVHMFTLSHCPALPLLCPEIRDTWYYYLPASVESPMKSIGIDLFPTVAEELKKQFIPSLDRFSDGWFPTDREKNTEHLVLICLWKLFCSTSSVFPFLLSIAHSWQIHCFSATIHRNNFLLPRPSWPHGRKWMATTRQTSDQLV